MIFLIFILLSPSSLLFSQNVETDPLSFFPSEVGNYWEYEPDNPKYNYTIVRDSIAEDGSKFIFYFDPPFYYGANYKIDTNNNVYFTPQHYPELLYKLSADSGDTWMVRDVTPSGGGNRIEARVNDTYKAYVLGVVTDVMDISYYELNMGDTLINDTSYHIQRKILASGFGLVWQGDGATRPTVLQGCIIDGKAYGTIVSVEEEATVIQDYSLSQNFPNPFNPSTTITYALPQKGEVVLKIYNSLGQEVKTLVNDFKEKGIHKVNFDASDLPSGVYIYSIQANDFMQSKKMILLK